MGVRAGSGTSLRPGPNTKGSTDQDTRFWRASDEPETLLTNFWRTTPERFILLIFTTGPTLRRHSRKQNSCLLVQAINGTHCMQDLAASDQTLSATSRTLPMVSAQLAEALEDDPLLQNDKELRMFCFIVKGDIDTETNTGAMRQDWEQVQTLARDLGDMKWQYRALAQFGIAAFYDADLETARKNVGTALAAATKAGDAGAQIRFLTILANGLLQAKMYEQALAYR